MIFDPIDRMWNSGGFQPSVHSETASSTIFYLWQGLENDLFIFENPEILSTPGWLYTYIYICIRLLSSASKLHDVGIHRPSPRSGPPVNEACNLERLYDVLSFVGPCTGHYLILVGVCSMGLYLVYGM